MLVGIFLSNCIVALLVTARGANFKWHMLGALAPLPIGLIAFKFYCKNTFDNSLKYYTQGDSKKGVEAPTPIDKESRKRDRVAVRFGYVALIACRFAIVTNNQLVTRLSTRNSPSPWSTKSQNTYLLKSTGAV